MFFIGFLVDALLGVLSMAVVAAGARGDDHGE